MARKTNSRRKLLLGLIAVIVVAGGGGGLYFYKKRPKPTSVQTEEVKRRDITETVEANGKIQPVLQVKISPEVSGEIIKLPVKEGQHVNRGDLLVQIKPQFYQAAVNQAEASYQSSRAGLQQSAANLEKSEFDFRRVQPLYESKLVSDSEFQAAKTTLDIARAQVDGSRHQVDVAKASLDRAREDLAKTTILSPLAGTVSKLNSELGERVLGTAQNMGTEIMVVSDLNQMEARVEIGEIDVVSIAVGQVTHLEVDSFRDKKFSGVVSEIANTARGSTPGVQQQDATKFEVRIRVTEKDAFRPGMSVTANIETRYRTNVLAVPIQSVTSRLPKPPAGAPASKPPEEPQPQIVEAKPGKEKKDDKETKPIEVVFLADGARAKMVSVKRGISNNEYVEILDGVTPGTQVISGGYKAINRELEDGKLIRVDSPSGNGKPKKEES